MQGLVSGGQSRAIVGARVYVLETDASTTGKSSTSLLTSATGHPADSIGYFALTGEYGGFSIAGDYNCSPGRSVYVYARGGSSGGTGSNSAIGLMAMLGPCPSSGTFDSTTPFIFVNAVTTVAAAYATEETTVDATHLALRKVPTANSDAGFPNRLADITTGFATLKGNTEPSRRMIHTIANILSACINSGSPASQACTTLLGNARSDGVSGELPPETATAAMNIAHHPHANVAALYQLQPIASPPYLPAFDSPPADFTLPVAPQGTIAFIDVPLKEAEP
jgi:hypothetical protein